MPRSTLAELVFALAFALVTTFVAGSIVTTDAHQSSSVRKERIEVLEEERCAIQIQAIRNWVDADPSGARKEEVKELVMRRTKRSLRELDERRLVNEVDGVYHALLPRMKP